MKNIMPVVHLNGTSKNLLRHSYKGILNAARELRYAWDRAELHPRDYYMLTQGEKDQAAADLLSRRAAIEDIVNYAEEVLEHLDGGQEFRCKDGSQEQMKAGPTTIPADHDRHMEQVAEFMSGCVGQPVTKQMVDHIKSGVTSILEGGKELATRRREVADRTFEEYDFGPFKVTDSDGWTIDGKYWSRKVYGNTEEGRSWASFGVEFVDNSTEVRATWCQG